MLLCAPQNPTLNCSGWNPGLRSDKTTANRLAHDADNIYVHSVFTFPILQITDTTANLWMLFRRSIASNSNSHKKVFSIRCKQNIETRVILNKCLFNLCDWLCSRLDNLNNNALRERERVTASEVCMCFLEGRVCS
jgi:hypothetical protein